MRPRPTNFPHDEPRVPHISPGFGEMWELTNPSLRCLRYRQVPDLEPLIPTSRQNQARYGAPAVRGKETSSWRKLSETADLSTPLRSGRDDKFARWFEIRVVTNLSSRPERSGVERSAVSLSPHADSKVPYRSSDTRVADNLTRCIRARLQSCRPITEKNGL
jgi:hypothetical protein